MWDWYLNAVSIVWTGLATSAGASAIAAGASAIAAMVSSAAAFLAWRTGKGQLVLARQKRRDDLYDRRFPIYLAFHNFIELVEQGSRLDSGKLNALYRARRKIKDAMSHAPFLLPQDLVKTLMGLEYDMGSFVSTFRLLPSLQGQMNAVEYGMKVHELSTEA